MSGSSSETSRVVGSVPGVGPSSSVTDDSLDRYACGADGRTHHSFQAGACSRTTASTAAIASLQSSAEVSTVTTPSAARDELRDRGVVAVPADDLVAGGGQAVGVRAAVDLQRPPRQPRLLARGEQDAHVGVRRHDRGDVAALGHAPAAALDRLGDDRALAQPQTRPDVEVASRRAETTGEMRVSRIACGDVVAADPDPGFSGSVPTSSGRVAIVAGDRRSGR